MEQKTKEWLKKHEFVVFDVDRKIIMGKCKAGDFQRKHTL